MARKPHEFERHTMGDNRRFHVRTYNCGLWQVYSVGLEHICECTTCEMADMIADTLERHAELHDQIEIERHQ